MQVETVPDHEDSYATPNKPNRAYLAETFDSPDTIGKKWIKSKAKKPDVEEDIAQYVGKFEFVFFRTDILFLSGELNKIICIEFIPTEHFP